jgi:hypothetical protein
VVAALAAEEGLAAVVPGEDNLPGPLFFTFRGGNHAGDPGDASALINCFALMFGSFGMILASLGGNNRIITLGLINILVGLVCLGAELGMSKRNEMIEVTEVATIT